MRRFLFGSVYIVFATTISTTGLLAVELPESLTLDYVMALPVDNVPQIQYAQADINIHEAKHHAIDAENDFNANLQSYFSYIEPSIFSNTQSHDDSRHTITLNKSVYDFGRTGYALDSAAFLMSSYQRRYESEIDLYYIELMRRYFAVLLSDLAFIRDNESMSIAYIRFDRASKKNKQGRVSDVDLLDKENAYFKERQKYHDSLARQKITRARLASILNTPDQLVANIAEPKLDLDLHPLPELNVVKQRAMKNNSTLLALKYRLKSAQAAVKSTRSDYWPNITAEAQAFEYERKLTSRNEWQVQLIIDVPIWTGDKVSAKVAEQNSVVTQAQSTLRKQELYIHSEAMILLEKLRVLKVQRERNEKRLEYRDLYLDRSRALYEMEFKSDLGDSMTLISAAKYRSAKVEYETMLTLAKLNALQGRPVYPFYGKSNEINQ